ncbi:MAG: hypothetical protein ACMUHU_03130 [Thermoplasmatota archaeon]
MSKREVPVHVKVMIVAVCALGSICLIFGGVLVYENLIYEEPRTDAILEVEEVYFRYEGYESGEYRISVKAFISNVGDRDCDVRIRAFAVDDMSNLAMDDAETDLGVVKADTTAEASFEISVIYDGLFTVELIVFKDELITVKGSGKVSLSEQQMGGKDYRNTVTDDTETAEEKASLPFPTAGAITITVLAAALIMGGYARRRWRK